MSRPTSLKVSRFRTSSSEFAGNTFQEQYEALAATSSGGTDTTVKKKGRKEIKLTELSRPQQHLFTGKGGSDEKEWDAWKAKDAVEVMDDSASALIRREKADLIGRTAKSRLVVQGFKDKSLGYYRRDAPTASATAESSYHRFVLLAKDIKNAYFSGPEISESQEGHLWLR